MSYEQYKNTQMGRSMPAKVIFILMRGPGYIKLFIDRLSKSYGSFNALANLDALSFASKTYVDWLVPEIRNSSALAMELRIFALRHRYLNIRSSQITIHTSKSPKCSYLGWNYLVIFLCLCLRISIIITLCNIFSDFFISNSVIQSYDTRQ